ncbi:CRISPR-associated helicase Cas3' [Lachnoclostridium sp. Marseille-P6806]|uniref:CRISPR-associated helicase Cas3' n=1 Tax=Lachnoclostridium sp. Marseille-P6806 TaxID=2364793 RepID=UPI001F5F2D88|nr:CRISPR-associated helicase Cas3' [Lachnoclostridium sp. Marseille-P6806]
MTDEELLLLAEKVLGDGANLGIVVNTVKKAQELGRKLTALSGEDKIEVFHSSFLAAERVKKEERLRKLLGKQKTDEAGLMTDQRPRGYIVIGTQVIEQSLDIDFDVMVSELAPIDLLLQRIGRLHRHEQLRPKGYENPVLYLLGTSSSLMFDEGSQAIYGGYLLTRAQYFMAEVIHLPGDIPKLVQSV